MFPTQRTNNGRGRHSGGPGNFERVDHVIERLIRIA
jgi:hypothetical protein